jgi:hypothetical protein
MIFVVGAAQCAILWPRVDREDIVGLRAIVHRVARTTCAGRYEVDLLGGACSLQVQVLRVVVGTDVQQGMKCDGNRVHGGGRSDFWTIFAEPRQSNVNLTEKSNEKPAVTCT